MNHIKTNKNQAVCDWVLEKIHWQIYLPGQRIPSVRALAKKLEVSTFTVAQAYDRLTAHGHLTAVRGSGYYVNRINPHNNRRIDRHGDKNTPPLTTLNDNVLQTEWLLGHLFNEAGNCRQRGLHRIFCKRPFAEQPPV